jgi:SpoVK/Ycf46/Vps4 family AAA+-type ATPase
MGAFQGIAHAFDLAKENSPAVLFFEDVDSWLSGGSMDLLKTEMDGIVKNSGLVTVLTTNFPERLPEALIDRPGRFHDVLQLFLPSPEIRKRMLEKWLPGMSEGDVKMVVAETEGDSGAHIYELANYAKTIMEDEELTIAQAAARAIKKIREQRDLINQVQLAGSNYRPRRELSMSSDRAIEKSLENATIVEDDAPASAPTLLPVAEAKDYTKDLAGIEAAIMKLADVFDKVVPSIEAMNGKLDQVVTLCEQMAEEDATENSAKSLKKEKGAAEIAGAEPVRAQSFIENLRKGAVAGAVSRMTGRTTK